MIERPSDASVQRHLNWPQIVHVKMPDDELPHEVVLSIQRVLSLESNPQSDPLDVLSSDFTPVDLLNRFFPDGMYASFGCASTLTLSTEASLGHIDAVQGRLVQNELDLQHEIDLLQDELKRDQDPGRMQLIQEMISVSLTRYDG